MNTNPFGAVGQAATRTVDAGLRAHFNQVYMTMALGLLITGVMAYVTSQNEALYGLLGAAQGNTWTRLLIAFSPMIIIMMAFNPYTMRKLSAPVLGLVFFAFSAYFGWLL